MKNYSPFFGEVNIDDKNQPILVYNVGKVGSRTIVDSIYASKEIQNQVFHTHTLNERNLEMEFYLSKTSVTDKLISHIEFSRQLMNTVKSNKNIRWKLITIVREPVSWFFSSLFESLDIGLLNDDPFICKKGNYIFNLNEFAEYFSEIYCKKYWNYFFNWFNIELFEYFKINVFNYPFEFEKGYSIIKTENADLLILRLEDFNKCFSISIGEFLGFSGLRMIISNSAEDKNYSNTYKFIKNFMPINIELIDKAYNEKLTKHFYSESEIEKFSNNYRNRQSVMIQDYQKHSINPLNILKGIKILNGTMNIDKLNIFKTQKISLEKLSEIESSIVLDEDIIFNNELKIEIIYISKDDNSYFINIVLQAVCDIQEKEYFLEVGTQRDDSSFIIGRWPRLIFYSDYIKEGEYLIKTVHFSSQEIEIIRKEDRNYIEISILLEIEPPWRKLFLSDNTYKFTFDLEID